MHQILRVYLNRLTNLSSRNKSLLLTRLPGEQFLDIMDTDYLLGQPAFQLIAHLIAGKKLIPICDLQDPRYEKVNQVSKKLRKISRTEKFIASERGTQDLYLGYPFIKGKLANGSVIHAPLLYFPVRLSIEKERWCIGERGDSRVLFNRSFGLAYAQFNETRVPNEILDKNFEDFSTDFLTFRTELYEWLKESPFKINFNQRLFENKIENFELLSGGDLKRLEKEGELKLIPEAVLGIFPQAGSFLAPDYYELLDANPDELQSRLLPSHHPEEADRNTSLKIKEEDILTPFAMDASQESIIKEVKRGQSLVVQGPPGSGKSQLICNLMADFAARGKKVLLVCQKRAALDVVYDRMSTIGLKPFIGLIHDIKNDRAVLYQQLKEQIEHIEAYKAENYSLDAVFIERAFLQASRQIDKILVELESFRLALFDISIAGVSVKELYLSSKKEGPVLNVDDIFTQFRLDEREHYETKFKRYLTYLSKLNKTQPWYYRHSFASYDNTDYRNICKLLSEWPEVYLKSKLLFQGITNLSFAKSFLVNFSEIQEELVELNSKLSSSQVVSFYQGFAADLAHTNQRIAIIKQSKEEFEGYVADEGIAWTVNPRELATVRQDLKEAINSKSSKISGKLFDWFNKKSKSIAQIAFAEGLSTSLPDLMQLEVKLRNRIQVERWLENPLLGFNSVDLADLKLNDELLQSYFVAAENAIEIVQIIQDSEWRTVFTSIQTNQTVVSELKDSYKKLKTWVDQWEKTELSALSYLSKYQFENYLLDSDISVQKIVQILESDFDSMCDMDQIYESMNSSERSVMARLSAFLEQQPHLNTEELLSVFMNSIHLAWINAIESEYPVLRSVSSSKMIHWENELQEAIQKRQILSIDIVGIRMRERTYEEVETNRLGNRVSYREVDHQVSKKRKIWPIRQLMESYSDDIFNLIPCWLASPESVSAIFPLSEDLFDLVIFDEASQCYAEYGIPASVRAKQIVVAGDSKQLSPSDLYKVRYEEQDEPDHFEPALEVNSLLDLAIQSLSAIQLTGHYRSKSLELIEFSNQHFYNHSLKLLPEFTRLNLGQPGIEFIKTEGIWKNNANLVEVETIVTLLKGYHETNVSVGIVTFNYFQQQAIEDRLEGIELNIKELFVKNIENVQGDEREVIIFSMGYAPDEKGKISMQFGSLNAQGGENRLNVAITRAKEKIYFVTSLFPEQLQVEGAANMGPKLLKDYMVYAQKVSSGAFMTKPVMDVKYKKSALLKSRLLFTNPKYCIELPFGDITVKNGAIFEGLVLTDDDQYYGSNTAKEPHAYLPILLKNKNWPYTRIFSREYWAKSRNLKD